MPLIDVRQLTKRFTTAGDNVVTALEGVDLSVEEGEFLTVVGPSGCGKTTLLTVLAGLDAPSEGTVLIDGEPISGPHEEASVVFQKPVLLPWKTVIDNVLMPIRAKRRPTESDRTTALELLEQVGLGESSQSYPFELSGGMAQRNGLARALITDPSIMLMDEPFAALDALTRERMMLHLAGLWERERRRTAVFITHNITEAVFLGDRVAVFSKGPGSIREEVPVNFPRPRTTELLATEDFNKQVAHVRNLLMDDA